MNLRRFDEFVLSFPKRAKILDAGCGNGEITKYVHVVRSDCMFYGVDLNEKERSKFPPYGKFYLKPVEKTGFKSNFFDVVVCLHVLEHIKCPEKVISEFHRILKKGGRVIIETPNKLTLFKPFGFNFYSDPTHVRPFSAKELEMLLTAHGFSIINRNDFDSSIQILLHKNVNLPKRLAGLVGLDKTVAWVVAIK